MKYVMKMSGWETELSEQEYRKLCRYFGPGRGIAQGARVLENGDIINLSQFNGIMCVREDGDQARAILPEDDLPAAIPEQTQTEATNQESSGQPAMTKEKFMEIYNKAGMDYPEFAKAIGYSPQTVRMAIKEGKISPALTDAVLKGFPQEGKKD